eukprot:CAMPEP_0184733894 /NCGR_PEP_ID=MMETSP0314-20130426/58798_1 /TAXON_ID=38298 /ORGANISM="Rhodella maculata, Strain CCMP 736" /LENGTH=60 /DNA_ID=CAMNT_0027200777 /DNA_START=56 /DNA_END=234 /DNA_ORIENTATION=+
MTKKTFLRLFQPEYSSFTPNHPLPSASDASKYPYPPLPFNNAAATAAPEATAPDYTVQKP